MRDVRGKSLKALIRDVAGGYTAVNPLFLKSFDEDGLRELFKEISKIEIEVRGEKFPTHDILAIRSRNLRLQRLYSAVMIIRNFARERRISLV